MASIGNHHGAAATTTSNSRHRWFKAGHLGPFTADKPASPDVITVVRCHVPTEVMDKGTMSFDPLIFDSYNYSKPAYVAYYYDANVVKNVKNMPQQPEVTCDTVSESLQLQLPHREEQTEAGRRWVKGGQLGPLPAAKPVMPGFITVITCKASSEEHQNIIRFDPLIFDSDNYTETGYIPYYYDAEVGVIPQPDVDCKTSSQEMPPQEVEEVDSTARDASFQRFVDRLPLNPPPTGSEISNSNKPPFSMNASQIAFVVLLAIGTGIVVYMHLNRKQGPKISHRKNLELNGRRPTKNNRGNKGKKGPKRSKGNSSKKEREALTRELRKVGDGGAKNNVKSNSDKAHRRHKDRGITELQEEKSDALGRKEEGFEQQQPSVSLCTDGGEDDGSIEGCTNPKGLSNSDCGIPSGNCKNATEKVNEKEGREVAVDDCLRNRSNRNGEPSDDAHSLTSDSEIIVKSPADIAMSKPDKPRKKDQIQTEQQMPKWPSSNAQTRNKQIQQTIEVKQTVIEKSASMSSSDEGADIDKAGAPKRKLPMRKEDGFDKPLITEDSKTSNSPCLDKEHVKQPICTTDEANTLTDEAVPSTCAVEQTACLSSDEETTQVLLNANNVSEEVSCSGKHKPDCINPTSSSRSNFSSKSFTFSLFIEGMTCGGCVKVASSTLNKFHDIVSAKVDLKTCTAHISCSTPQLDLLPILVELDNVGFHAFLKPSPSNDNSKQVPPLHSKTKKEELPVVTGDNIPASSNIGHSYGVIGPPSSNPLSFMDELRIGTKPLRRYRCSCNCDGCICSSRPMHRGDVGEDITLSDLCDRLQTTLDTDGRMLEKTFRETGGSTELRSKISQLTFPCGCDSTNMSEDP